MTQRRGTVVSFDEQAGLGTISSVGSDGIVGNFAFHCIEIADGTRTIDADIDVSFDPLPRFGRIEAAHIRPA